MKKLLLLLFVLLGTISNAQQTFWEEVSTGFLTTSTTEAQISYADANTVWVYAAAGDGSGDYYQQWGRSIDGGVTWTIGDINVGTPDLVIGSIHAVSATKAYVTAWANGTTTGGVWVTNDAGVSWQKQPSALYNTVPDSFPNILHFWGTDIGVTMGDPAGGYFEIYTTTNGGTNWTRLPSSNIPAQLPGEYGYTHNYEVNGNTIWFGTNKGRIYRSTNQGLNWTVAQTPIADFGSATISGNYSFKDQNNGLLIASDFQFFRTTDGASTWVAETPTGYFRNFDVSFVPGTPNVYVTTGEDPDGIGRGSSYSVDGGLNWTDINETDVLPVDGGGSLAFYDCTHGLASGFTADSVTGGIWHNLFDYCSLGTSDFASANTTTASPNPTSGLLEINGKNINQVVVYDVLGKVVLTNTYSTLNNVSMNLGSLNNGVYMVKVTNNLGNTSTIKVVKN